MSAFHWKVKKNVLIKIKEFVYFKFEFSQTATLQDLEGHRIPTSGLEYVKT